MKPSGGGRPIGTSAGGIVGIVEVGGACVGVAIPAGGVAAGMVGVVFAGGVVGTPGVVDVVPAAPLEAVAGVPAAAVVGAVGATLLGATAAAPATGPVVGRPVA
jgi:hypothetical protein